MHYNSVSMIECTDALNKILSESCINEESLNRFKETALSVDWDGPNATDFRSEVICIIEFIMKGNKIHPLTLRSLAMRPKTFGEMYENFDRNLCNQRQHRFD